MGDFDAADAFHFLFAFGLFFEEFALAGDVAAVAFGENVFAHGADGFAGDDFAADGCLDGNFEELAGDEVFEFRDECAADFVGVLGVGDDGEGIDGLAVDEDVDFDEAGGAVLLDLVIEAGVAGGRPFELVVEVDEDFGHGDVVFEEDAGFAGCEVVFGFEEFHAEELAPAAGDELHDLSDVPAGGDDVDLGPGLGDDGDFGWVGEVGWVVDEDFFAGGELDAVFDGGGGGEEFEAVFAFEAFDDDFEVEEAEEAAAKAEAEGGGGFGFVDEGSVVEDELGEGVAELLVLVGIGGVDACEDHGLGAAVAGEGLWCGLVGPGDGVADTAFGDVFEAGGDVADFAGGEAFEGPHAWAEDAEFEWFEDGSGGHEAEVAAAVHLAVEDADVGDDAFVAVVFRIEDEGFEGCGGVAAGGWDALDDGFEDGIYAGAFFGAGEDDLVTAEADDALEFGGDAFGFGVGEVDLVEDRDEGEVLVHGEVDVGECLGFDALGGVDDEEGAFAGGE